MTLDDLLGSDLNAVNKMAEDLNTEINKSHVSPDMRQQMRDKMFNLLDRSSMTVENFIALHDALSTIAQQEA